MIGSHDTYTFQKAKNPLVNLISKFWRCQSKNIEEQYNSGVRFFDIRVFRNKKGKWQTAHGLAEFSTCFDSIEDICRLFEGMKVMYRIWMEKGSDYDWELFLAEANGCKHDYPGFVQGYRKFKYPLFSKTTYPRMEYFACEMEKPENFLKGVYTNPIKDYAKKHNPVITQEMIDDPSVIYFMDYV